MLKLTRIKGKELGRLNSMPMVTYPLITNWKCIFTPPTARGPQEINPETGSMEIIRSQVRRTLLELTLKK